MEKSLVVFGDGGNQGKVECLNIRMHAKSGGKSMIHVRSCLSLPFLVNS